MFNHPSHLASWRLLAASILLALACLLLSTPAASAQDPTGDVDTCTSCHTDQADAWLASPHMTLNPESVGDSTGASCVDCHGPYVKDHPAAGTVRLSVDSSLCQDCHTGTYDQWQHTQHAGEGVQCISCHKPHSQELRLTDETLCQSCHRGAVSDPLHMAHWDNQVACTNCHMNGHAPSGTLAAGDALAVSNDLALLTPSHDFVSVSPQHCLDCHRNDVVNPSAGSQPTTLTTADVEAQLAAAQRNNKALWTISAANLGFGVGIGGILGIVFMLAAAKYFPRSES